MNFLYTLQDVKISLERINEIHGKDNEESNEKAWVCQDFIEVPSTLTMVAPESMKPVADGYVRFKVNRPDDVIRSFDVYQTIE